MTHQKEKKKRDVNPNVCQLLIWNVPRALKTKFKATCVRKGTTMRTAILNFLREYRD